MAVGKTLLGIGLTVLLGGTATWGAVETVSKNKLKNDNENLTNTVLDITDENRKLNNDKTKLLADIRQNEEERLKLIDGLNSANMLKLEALEKVDTLTSQLKDKTSALEEKTKAYNETLAKYNAIIVERDNLQIEVNNLQDEVNSLNGENQSLTAQLQTKTTELEQKEIELQQAQTRLNTLSSEVNTLTQQVSSLEEQIQQKNQEIENLNLTITSLNQTLDERDKRIEELEKQLASKEPLVLTPGLYETGKDTLKKSWTQLVDDGDISIGDGVFIVNNKYIAGDLVCDSVNNLSDMSKLFEDCKNLTSIDLSRLNTSNVTNMSNVFCGCDSLKTLNLEGFNTSNVTTMSKMFSNCNSLQEINVSCFDTSKVTNMDWMFSDCKGLTNLDLSNFDTSSVTSMYGMFSSCSSLFDVNLSSFDTSNVSDFSSMFLFCDSLQSVDLSNFICNNITNMSSMFSYCESLKSIDVSNFIFSNLTSIDSLFNRCCNLETLNLGCFDTANVTDTFWTFYGTSSLKTIIYSGTIEEWKSKNINYETTEIKEDGSITVKCNDGDYVIGYPLTYNIPYCLGNNKFTFYENNTLKMEVKNSENIEENYMFEYIREGAVIKYSLIEGSCPYGSNGEMTVISSSVIFKSGSSYVICNDDNVFIRDFLIDCMHFTYSIPDGKDCYLLLILNSDSTGVFKKLDSALLGENEPSYNQFTLQLDDFTELGTFTWSRSLNKIIITSDNLPSEFTGEFEINENNVLVINGFEF